VLLLCSLHIHLTPRRFNSSCEVLGLLHRKRQMAFARSSEVFSRVFWLNIALGELICIYHSRRSGDGQCNHLLQTVEFDSADNEAIVWWIWRLDLISGRLLPPSGSASFCEARIFIFVLNSQDYFSFFTYIAWTVFCFFISIEGREFCSVQ